MIDVNEEPDEVVTYDDEIYTFDNLEVPDGPPYLISNGLPIMEVREVEVVAEAYPTMTTFPLKGVDWNFNAPSPELQLDIQKALAERGRYHGRLNGTWGNGSVYAIRQTVGHVGPELDLDLCIRIQQFAEEVGGYASEKTAPGVLDGEVWTGFLLGLQEGL